MKRDCSVLKLAKTHLSYQSSIYIYIYMLHKKTVLVKKRHVYVQKLLFYKLTGCKNTAFLQINRL